jgi:hypothetical protein
LPQLQFKNTGVELNRAGMEDGNVSPSTIQTMRRKEGFGLKGRRWMSHELVGGYLSWQ